MKKNILMTIILISTSCNREDYESSSEFSISCEKVFSFKGVLSSLYRCENQEVICYRSKYDELQCKFKENNQ